MVLRFFYIRDLFLILLTLSLVTALAVYKLYPESVTASVFPLSLSKTLEVTESAGFFENSNSFKYNSFEYEDGLFSFEYKNHFRIKRNQGIYFLEDLQNKYVAFQIFENHDRLEFSQQDFQCMKYIGDKEEFSGREVCFTKENSEENIINLELFGTPDRFFNQQLNFFATKGLIGEVEKFNKYAFFSRADAVEFILKLKYPLKDFSEYADNCFFDVFDYSPFSGPVCFAKKEGVIVGIGDSFYPNQSVNLMGVLKILFKTFEVEDMVFQERFFDEYLFEQMPKIHVAYPLIAKSYYEGFFENYTGETLWANRSVYKGEALQIMHRFLEWKEGKTIRNYDYVSSPYPQNFIYLQSEDSFYRFEEDIGGSFKSKNADLAMFLQNEDDVDIFILMTGNVYEKVHSLPSTKVSKIEQVLTSFDPERLEGKINILFTNGVRKIYESDIKKKQFKFLKEEFEIGGYSEAKEKLQSMNLLTNSVPRPEDVTIPQLKVYLNEDDFKNIFIHRTSDKRYKAFLEIIYPDGEVEKRSILIKTRGNANRGYIKSSFTIESFKDFDQSFTFEGDEFLENSDEFKLRGSINEQTMIHEKLFYEIYRRMGYIAPDFFGSILEINGVPMGFYQVTEPIKKQFFKRRNIDTKNYYYARNSGSIYNTNLKYYENDKTTLSQYKIRGDSKRLLALINNLEGKNTSVLREVNTENVFDYALLVYLLHAKDSLTHNFYVYFDDNTQKWNIFPWDADDCFLYISEFNKDPFLAFTQKNTGTYNNLIYFLFQNLDGEAIDFYFENFRSKWNENVKILDLIEEYKEAYGDYFRYDNKLWNGKFLERKKPYFNSLFAIKKLLRRVGVLEEL